MSMLYFDHIEQVPANAPLDGPRAFGAADRPPFTLSMSVFSAPFHFVIPSPLIRTLRPKEHAADAQSG